MTIPAEHHGRYVYHMTHLDNLPSIIQLGLLCTNRKDRLGIKHHNIAYQDIQKRRAGMDVTAGPGGKVHDYVPFYFCARDPMLLAQLNHKNIDQHLLIILALNVEVLCRPDAVFTDRAANAKAPPIFFKEPQHLSKLNWPIIEHYKWGYQDEERANKMAECLVHHAVAFDEIGFIVVFNNGTEQKVNAILTDHGVNKELRFGDYTLRIGNSNKSIYHYYTRFSVPNEKNHTLVVGPELLFSKYQNLIQQIPQHQNETLSYPNIDQALAALDANPRVLSELNALDGLQPAKRPHWQDALAHTLNVVTKIQGISRADSVDAVSAKALKLAAYLHDIGKANSPREKSTGKYESDPNHPERAIELLGRVFTEEINLDSEQISLVCKLVVYHDLIGDVIGKGRHREQIIQVVDSMDEFDMLAQICIADVQSLNNPQGNLFTNREADSWLQNIQTALPDLRIWVEQQIAARDHA